MQSPSQLPFPGSRTLALWWRHFQPNHPGALWVGYVHLHRIEAAVQVTQQRRVEPLARLLLEALTIASGSSPCCGKGESLHRVQERLHLPASALRQLLRGLEQDALVRQTSAESWSATERGRGALTGHEYTVDKEERRVFAFAERVDDQGRRLLPPHFVPLAECPAAPWQVRTENRFEIGLLDESLVRPEDWKQQHGFPLDIAGAAAEAGTLAWRRVAVDRPEVVCLALIDVGAELLGFAAQGEDWSLLDDPVLRLPAAAARAIWSVLDAAPAAEVLREAWSTWSRQRGVPPAEADGCVLNYRAGRLEVTAPERLLNRLRAARSEVFKGDSWLLLGAGYLRQAVVVQISARPRAEI